MSLPWYRREPEAWLRATRKLSLEERGAYNDVIELMYLRGRSLEDDDSEISHELRVDVRVWRRIKKRLVQMGRLTVKDGRIYDDRTEEELAYIADIRRKKAIAGAKPKQKKAGSRERIVENIEKIESTCLTEDELIRDRDIYTPLPPKGDESAFEQFWSSYPHRKNRPSKGKVRPKFERALKKVPPDRLLAAVERYRDHLANKGSLEFSKGVDAWLNQECWESWLEQEGPKTVEPLDWGMAVKVFRDKGSWHSGYGPRPNEDGCRAPSEVLKAHGYTEAA